MFSEALFIFSLSFRFSKAANLFEILFWYSFLFLTSNSLSFLRLNLLHQTSVLLVYLGQSIPNFCTHQIVISITVSPPERSYMGYTRMPFPIYQYVIILFVSLRIWKCRSLFMNVPVREHRAFNNWTCLCGQVYYSNVISLTILM